MTEQIHKYPRTRHLEGSRLQPGDHDLDQVPLDALRGRFVVVEEKLDGANAGIAVVDGALRLQSRGHALVGGAREKHWDLFKRWASAHAGALIELLRDGHTLYGEWLYAKHTIFYDELPHYFLEFDIRDATGEFWSTARRRAHLRGAPIVSVPVIWQGVVDDPPALPALVATSLYKSARWRDRLRRRGRGAHVEPDRAAAETDPRRSTPRGSTSRSRSGAWSSIATSGCARRSSPPSSIPAATGWLGRSCRTSSRPVSTCSR